jgi:hypothetical protein
MGVGNTQSQLTFLDGHQRIIASHAIVAGVTNSHCAKPEFTSLINGKLMAWYPIS